MLIEIIGVHWESNEILSGKLSGKLTELFVTEEPMEFLTPLSDVGVMETETATLSCEVSKPDQTAKWLKAGKEVRPSGRIEIRVDGTKHTLIIQDAHLDDHDEYSVVIGDKSSTATVFVEGMSWFPHQNINL